MQQEWRVTDETSIASVVHSDGTHGVCLGNGTRR